MQDEPTLDVVLCGDAGVARPTGVVIRSIVKSSQEPHRLRFTCLTTGWSVQERRFVERAAGAANLSVHDLSSTRLPSMHAGAFVPQGAYLRFATPMYVEQSRALYVDSDVIVRRDLSALWAEDLRGHSTGACRAGSTPFIGSPGAVEGWRRLGLEPSAPALNSGVLLMDLDAWREQRLSERAFAVALEHGSSFRLADQATLNVVLNGDWHALHPTWNAASGVFEDDKGLFAVEADERIAEAARDPSIVHFTGPRKPWRHYVDRPFIGEWRSTSQELGWAPWEEPVPLRVRASRAEHLLRRRLRR